MWSRLWIPCGDSDLTRSPAREIETQVTYSKKEDKVVLEITLEMNGFWLLERLYGYEISHPSLECCGELGAPTIPSAHAEFVLPAGTADIHIEELEAPSRILSGEYYIPPFRGSLFEFEDDLDHSQTENPELYHQGGWYPNVGVQLHKKGCGPVRGLDTLGMCIHPVRYAPREKRIMVMQFVRFNAVCTARENFTAYPHGAWEDFEASPLRNTACGWTTLRSFEKATSLVVL